MIVEKGIVFQEIQGYRALELDIYRPDHADGLLPLIQFVHGGAWRVSHRGFPPRETRGWDRGFFQRLTDAGFVVAANAYRFSSEATFPAQIDDCGAALAWLRANGEAYGADVDRIALFGASAGGHLVSLLGLGPAGNPGADPAGNSGNQAGHPGGGAIRGVACWYPVTDFSICDLDATDSFEAALFGGPLRDHPDQAAAASATSHVHPDAPPFHFAHGTEDTMAKFEHSQRMVDGLRANGVDVSFRVVEGAEHFYAGREEEIESILDETLEFLQNVTR
jgi:acetyl esterase/lipase